MSIVDGLQRRTTFNPIFVFFGEQELGLPSVPLKKFPDGYFC
jgi:hypothetical protein